MAKTPASTLISDLCKRVDMNPGTTGDGSAERLDALRMLNSAQSALLQDHSLRFLVDEGTLTLNSAASSAAVPTTIDDGKLITLGRATGDGEIEYVPPDEWYRTHLDTYRMPTQTGPSYWTISRVAGVNTFLFKPGNTSGGALSIPYKAQAVPVAITDSASSESSMPLGWEDSLLIDRAEIDWRRLIGEPVPDDLLARTTDKQERLYSSYRTSKEQPMTDREQIERKVAREQYAPEKP
jgi:hypothetical protein